MAKRQRDYSNLRETEIVYDASKRSSTQVKDYSLTHVIAVAWDATDLWAEADVALIDIGDEQYAGAGWVINEAVHEFVEEADADGWIPRKRVEVMSFENYTKPLVISTMGVNQECLRDHVARVTIGKNSAIIDLEELLKATRYA